MPLRIVNFTEGPVEESFCVTNKLRSLPTPQMANPSLTARRKQHRVPSISPSMSPLPSGVHAQSTAAHMGLVTLCVCVALCSKKDTERSHSILVLIEATTIFLFPYLHELFYYFKNPWSSVCCGLDTVNARHVAIGNDAGISVSNLDRLYFLVP